MGIGLGLAAALIEKAKESGLNIFVVQTEASNIAAINVAKKLGFDEPFDTFFQENENGLKYRRLANGICLYKES